MTSSHSEYGGAPGIIQPDVSRVHPDAAAAGLGHESTEDRAADRRGVRDAAMIVRRAGIKEANGQRLNERRNPDTGVRENDPYTEEQAREDYITGNNY
jgi:hypothetical protein